MESVSSEWGNLNRFVKMIAAQFGPNCEVVLHDHSKDYNHTIVAIENGHITGRNVGDCGSNLGLEVLRGKENAGDKYNYITQLKDGRIVRSSTTYLQNDAGEIIGSICINFDITDLLNMESLLQKHAMFTIGDSEQVDESFATDVSELLEELVIRCQKKIGKPVSSMDRNDKIDAIHYLDSKGAFLVSKAGDRICEFLNISKYTLYNYLDLARNNGKYDK